VRTGNTSLICQLILRKIINAYLIVKLISKR
jgi:hypothetical protein